MITDSANEYMSKIHPSLANNYRTPDGKYSQSCTCIAADIAEKLLSEGKNPYIIQVRGKLVDRINRESITPKQFGKRVVWGAHQVCCSDGLAYDPMVGPGPVALSDYCLIAFDGAVEMDVLVEKNDIREFLGRRPKK